MSFVLGLTGSIGMGKSTTSGFFRDEGVPIWDADAAVHTLYAEGGAAVGPIAAICAEAVQDGAINRPALRDWIARDQTALMQIESVVHPLVAQDRMQFLKRHSDAPLVVLDIPLLFEGSGEASCDATLVVSAPADIQRARVMERAGMTEAHFQTILSKQMPDAEKRARATYVIETLTPDQTRAEVRDLIDRLTGTHQDA